MADKRESFPSLEDATGAGVPLAKVEETDAAAGKNASAALVAKRASDGSLRYLQLDDAGNLQATLEGGGVCKRAGTDGTPVAGSASKTTVAEIALTVAKTYRKLEWAVCNFRDTVYEIELIDDPNGTPSIVQSLAVIVGPGDYTSSDLSHCFEFDTTGMTEPTLRLSGTNLNATSDFRGQIAIEENAA